MFSSFPSEKVVLKKTNGEIIHSIKAVVTDNLFAIDDVNIRIEEGDFFERMLPNGEIEHYIVLDRGFKRGFGAIRDHYQTKVRKASKSELSLVSSGREIEEKDSNKKAQKVFISHSSQDRAYMKAFVELLEDIGMPDGAIVCSSIPGYGIPGGAKIFEWLREQFVECDLRVVFALSKNYYNSPVSLNEMGAAWVTKAADTLLLLPGFNFGDIKGCIDPTEIGIKLDGDVEELRHRLNELKETLIEEHELPKISDTRWERRRNQFIEEINRIITEHKGENTTPSEGINDKYPIMSPAEAKFPNQIPLEPAFLVVYAASADGLIIRELTLSGRTMISAAGKTFMKNDSTRERVRWQGALDKLVSWRWVIPIGSKGELFELTDDGFNMADQLKAGMGIDTSREPLDELKEFE